MNTVVEVFADINCPFTQVGLKRVSRELAESAPEIRIHVRAWPLEWVNGEVLDVAGVQIKAKRLTEQLNVNDFAGFDPTQWPTTTIPALNLAAAAYDRDMAAGLEVSLDIRAALFERGQNVGDPEVLAALASKHDLAAPPTEPVQSVLDDYAEGKLLPVKGSPHFWAKGGEVFCPSLDLGHDEEGQLTALFATNGLSEFIDMIQSSQT
jgi:predicted DsbA family dithiol-disulfide isomerase